MLKRIAAFVLSFIFLISLSGCATSGKKSELEMQGLKNQISVLEAQIQSKDEEINSLRDTLNNITLEKEKAGSSKVTNKKKVVAEVKSRPNNKQIQTALKNAGYNPGAIDGRIGQQTKDAITAFQKDNNLTADEKMGKLTWNLLKEFLYKKVK